MQVLIEALVVGLVFAILVLIASFAFGSSANPAILGFVSGFIGHLVFEAVGANKWYCANGAACKRV